MLTCGTGYHVDQKNQASIRRKHTEQKLERKIKALQMLINECNQSEDVKAQMRKQVVESFK